MPNLTRSNGVELKPPPVSGIRITSYNVCYTKLLRPLVDTIDIAKKLYPNAKQIVGITDDSITGRGSLKQFYDIDDIFPELNFTHMTCSSMTRDDIIEYLSSLDEKTILVITSYSIHYTKLYEILCINI